MFLVKATRLILTLESFKMALLADCMSNITCNIMAKVKANNRQTDKQSISLTVQRLYE